MAKLTLNAWNKDRNTFYTLTEVRMLCRVSLSCEAKVVATERQVHFTTCVAMINKARSLKLIGRALHSNQPTNQQIYNRMNTCNKQTNQFPFFTSTKSNSYLINKLKSPMRDYHTLIGWTSFFSFKCIFCACPMQTDSHHFRLHLSISFSLVHISLLIIVLMTYVDVRHRHRQSSIKMHTAFNWEHVFIVH